MPHTQMGNTVRELRRKANLTQEQLADRVHMTKGGISAIETGKSNPPKSTIKLLAEALGVPDSVLTGASEPDVKYLTLSTDVKSTLIHKPEEIAEGLRYVPFIPLAARATFAEFYEDNTFIDKQITHPVFGIPDTKEYANALVVEVNGDSMEPHYVHGAKVLISPVPQSEWEYASGGPFAVLFRQTFVIKRIKTNTLRETGELMLYSDNPNGGNLLIKGEDLRAMWRVKCTVYAPAV